MSFADAVNVAVDWLYADPLHMACVWLAALVVFLGSEALTTSLICIWFAVGALGALVTVCVTDNIVVQAAVFLVVSIAALASVRPLARRFLSAKKIATNADRIIGGEAIVTEEVNNREGSGKVTIGSMPWTARAEGGAVIPAGETVKVLRIEGVKVYVERQPNRSGGVSPVSKQV